MKSFPSETERFYFDEKRTLTFFSFNFLSFGFVLFIFFPSFFGKTLFLAAPVSLRAKPYWVDGANHNNIESYSR